MRLIATTTVLSSLLLAFVATGGEARSKKPDCRRAGQTVTANEVARIFLRGDESYHRVDACWTPGRRARFLGETNLETADGDSIGNISLVGRRVAFSLYSGDRLAGPTGRVFVVDIRTGRTVASDDDSRYGRSIADVVLTESGSAAYVERRDSGLRVVALTGKRRTILDETPGIERGTLAVRGDRVYWLRAGAPQTATLP